MALADHFGRGAPRTGASIRETLAELTYRLALKRVAAWFRAAAMALAGSEVTRLVDRLHEMWILNLAIIYLCGRLRAVLISYHA